MKKRNVQKKDMVSVIAREKKLRATLVLNIVNSFLKKIVHLLSQGERLEFRDFGVFEVVKRKAKIGRNPMKSQESIKIPAKNVVKFTPGKKLKKVVQ